MTTALFTFPAQAQFGKVLPKSKIYQHANPSAAVKELFVKQVEQIVWQYKLAPETINLPAKAGIPEIQIFTLHLKTPELDESVLRCIDQAIPFAIVFQLHFAEQIKIVAAYKTVKTSDQSMDFIDCYFASAWLPVTSSTQALPVVLDLGSLYHSLLRALIPLTPRANESVPEQIQRYRHWQTKQREYQKLEARLHKEKQFNRKVALNAQLRAVQTELSQLKPDKNTD